MLPPLAFGGGGAESAEDFWTDFSLVAPPLMAAINPPLPLSAGGVGVESLVESSDTFFNCLIEAP